MSQPSRRKIPKKNTYSSKEDAAAWKARLTTSFIKHPGRLRQAFGITSAARSYNEVAAYVGAMNPAQRHASWSNFTRPGPLRGRPAQAGFVRPAKKASRPPTGPPPRTALNASQKKMSPALQKAFKAHKLTLLAISGIPPSANITMEQYLRNMSNRPAAEWEAVLDTYNKKVSRRRPAATESPKPVPGGPLPPRPRPGDPSPRPAPRMPFGGNAKMAQDIRKWLSKKHKEDPQIWNALAVQTRFGVTATVEQIWGHIGKSRNPAGRFKDMKAEVEKTMHAARKRMGAINVAEAAKKATLQKKVANIADRMRVQKEKADAARKSTSHISHFNIGNRKNPQPVPHSGGKRPRRMRKPKRARPESESDYEPPDAGSSDDPIAGSPAKTRRRVRPNYEERDVPESPSDSYTLEELAKRKGKTGEQARAAIIAESRRMQEADAAAQAAAAQAAAGPQPDPSVFAVAAPPPLPAALGGPAPQDEKRPEPQPAPEPAPAPKPAGHGHGTYLTMAQARERAKQEELQRASREAKEQDIAAFGYDDPNAPPPVIDLTAEDASIEVDLGPSAPVARRVPQTVAEINKHYKEYKRNLAKRVKDGEITQEEATTEIKRSRPEFERERDRLKKRSAHIPQSPASMNARFKDLQNTIHRAVKDKKLSPEEGTRELHKLQQQFEEQREAYMAAEHAKGEEQARRTVAAARRVLRKPATLDTKAYAARRPAGFIEDEKDQPDEKSPPELGGRAPARPVLAQRAYMVPQRAAPGRVVRRPPVPPGGGGGGRRRGPIQGVRRNVFGVSPHMRVLYNQFRGNYSYETITPALAFHTKAPGHFTMRASRSAKGIRHQITRLLKRVKRAIFVNGVRHNKKQARAVIERLLQQHQTVDIRLA